MLRLPAVVSFVAAIASLLAASAASAQPIPMTLEVSGEINSVNNTVFPDVAVGTTYTLEYDLMVNTPGPVPGTNNEYLAFGEVTLTIEGQVPVTESGSCRITYENNVSGDLDRISFRSEGIGSLSTRSVRFLTDYPGDLVFSDPPRAALINNAPVAPQVANMFAFTESAPGPWSIAANITAFSATGGALPPPPVITDSPESDLVDMGEVASFTVDVFGEELIYQWRRDGVPLTDGPGIVGANASTLLITADNPARFDCVVSNPSGTETSEDAVLAVRNTCPADQNNDGMLSPTDFTAWIANYNNGCP
ncbi:MAG: hypothetical protein Phyf2KO_00010 [Phycisphaerales bacterium]